MSEKRRSFRAGIDFEAVLRIISKQIYDTPYAFIRENVQNAVDAIRIQAHREEEDPRDDRYRIDIIATGYDIVVRDNGIGMSASDLEEFFLEHRRQWKTDDRGTGRWLCWHLRHRWIREFRRM